MFKARNREFFRDKAAFGWNFIFPFLIVIGFGIIFGGDNKDSYKIGIFPVKQVEINLNQINLPDNFKQMKYLNFIGFEDFDTAQNSLKHLKIDLLIENKTGKYWISDSSPKGYTAEKYYLTSLYNQQDNIKTIKQEIKGSQIRYIDWLFPGVLAMNMMFSSLWGVGFIIVRYRKNGVLKRLKATPLKPVEYLSAQLVSRMFLLMFTLLIVWVGCDFIFDFHIEGSLMSIFFMFFLGGTSLTSMGMLMAARGVSEEFTSGILNFLTWPMMFLSGVWFSIEGAPDWVVMFSKIFPLTHMLSAIRKIMNDGAVLTDVSSEIFVMTAMTFIFLSASAYLFKWNGE